MIADITIAAILLIIIGAAVVYMVKEKRRGVRCIGCPSGGTCPHKEKCSGACHSGSSEGKGECHCGSSEGKTECYCDSSSQKKSL